MKSIADTAHSLGLKVMLHAHGARGIEMAARAGIDSIEHGTYIDDAAIKAMKDNGTVLVPTLMAFQGIYERLGKRSEEHTSELQSLMRISYAVLCLKKKKKSYK